MTGSTFEARNARHFDGLTPEPRPAFVRLEPGALVLEGGDGVPRRWTLANVQVVSADRSGVQLELFGERIEALILSDPGFAQALRAANGGQKLKSLGGGAPAVRILIAIGVAFVLLLFCAWRWGVPALAGIAAEHVPPEWERRFGAMVVKGMAPERVHVTDERMVSPVRGVFDLLVANQASSRDSFQLIVIGGKMVNAFAAPGGFVVVTTGLLDAMRGPEELAAVLAHEISHVARRHTTRGLLARLGVRALFSLIAGDQSGVGQALGAAGTLGELSYSRNDETDADLGAAELLARSGIDPSALDRALESISGGPAGKQGLDLGFLSTHPSTAGRRERAREIARGLKVQGSAILPDAAAWQAMQEAASAIRPTSTPR
ncbi:MAG: M48 family metallopeptidase [Candidatus Eisenbacteria bacterium]